MKTNLEWQVWGNVDPLWGVAAWKDRRRGGAHPWTDDEFYALGKDWLQFDRIWRALLGHNNGTVLEIGCGAGRITRYLSGDFEHVIAVDVSDGMIAYAKERVMADNITWQVTGGDSLPAEDATVDAVFSCHVFQHFPDAAAQVRIFAEIHRVLRPSGTFLIHLPLHSFPACNRYPSLLFRGTYAAFLRVSSVKAAFRRLLVRWFHWGYMHGISHEIDNLLTVLKKLGFCELGVTFLTDDGIQPCVYGRKSDRATT